MKFQSDEEDVWLNQFQEWLWDAFIKNVMKARRQEKKNLILKEEVFSALALCPKFYQCLTLPEDGSGNPIFLGVTLIIERKDHDHA